MQDMSGRAQAERDNQVLALVGVDGDIVRSILGGGEQESTYTENETKRQAACRREIMAANATERGSINTVDNIIDSLVLLTKGYGTHISANVRTYVAIDVLIHAFHDAKFTTAIVVKISELVDLIMKDTNGDWKDLDNA